MDILSHFLTGRFATKIKWVRNKSLSNWLIIGALVPDIGEIFLQIALSEKYNEPFGVYDSRTSDLAIASALNITWIYDLLHSIPIILLLLIISFFLKKLNLKKLFLGISIGLITHIILDFCTHGHIWALKLLFPFSNHRFKFFPDTIGNWWDWTPKVAIPFTSIEFPIYNFAFWILILLLTYIINKK